jgi:carbon-monoxide dehydrogenase medium subunit
MYPYPFSYHRPASVDEALALLGEHGDSGKLLAGGHSLLPIMKLRLAQPEHLIDISGLSDLAGVRLDGDTLVIGALTTHHQLETDATLAQHAGLLADVAHVVGDQQVRNRGTIGGALAHADVAADYPAAVLALDAEVLATGPNGERRIPISEFFLGFLTTALEPTEILTAIRVPVLAPQVGYHYEKLANPASGYAIVGVAAVVTLGEDGTIATARIGITGVADVAYRPASVEAALVGASTDKGTITSAAQTAVDGVEILGDVHAPADYRARVTRNLVGRTIERAVSKAQTSS